MLWIISRQNFSAELNPGIVDQLRQLGDLGDLIDLKPPNNRSKTGCFACRQPHNALISICFCRNMNGW